MENERWQLCGRMGRSSVVVFFFFFTFVKLLCVMRSGEKKEIGFTVEKRPFGEQSPEEYW